jgi:hypothetical protein
MDLESRATTSPVRRQATAATRPPGWIAPATVIGSVALAAVGVAWSDGDIATGFPGVLTFVGLCIGFPLGLFDGWRAFDAWLLTLQCADAGDVVVERRWLGRATLRFDRSGAVGRRALARFAVVSAKIWELRARADVDIDATIERRGLLSRGGVSVHDAAFDKAFVVHARDIAPAHLAARLSSGVRAAIARLFAHRAVIAVTLTMDGVVDVRLAGHASAREVAQCSPELDQLIAALGARGGDVAVQSLLRGRSPDGNPVGS